jgi:hypothetical protein
VTGGSHADVAGSLERVRRLFAVFAGSQGPGRSAVYAALTAGIVADDQLCGLLLDAPSEQRRPSLLFAAVNYLLAADPGAPLTEYYPIHGGQRPVDDQLVPAFAEFCADHRDALAALMRARFTQTNDVRRCVALRLGLAHVRRHWAGAIALVEIGASAGLNLLVDRYAYDVGGHRSGPTAAAVTISCALRGGVTAGDPLGPVPVVTHRLGVDRVPLDVSSPDARAWLEAFVWPEQVDELVTLRGALDLAATTGLARVVAGDAITDTARLIRSLPGTEPVVVFTASLLSYLTGNERHAFADQLRRAALRRPLAWVFAEAPALLPAAGTDIPAAAGLAARSESVYLVGVSALDRARRRDSLLALADPYLRWLAPARSITDPFAWLADGEA